MTPGELRTAYIQALIDRVRFIYVNAPSLDDALITTPYWDELQDLQRRIEGLLFEQTPITMSIRSKTFNAVHKRSNGAGSIYQRKDSRWVASVMRAGRRISRYTRSEVAAQEALAEHFEHEGPLTGVATPAVVPEVARETQAAHSVAPGPQVQGEPPPSEADAQEAAATARGGTSDRGEGFPSRDGVTEPPAASLDCDCVGGHDANCTASHLTNEAENDGPPAPSPADDRPYCIDGCGRIVSKRGGRCMACGSKRSWTPERRARAAESAKRRDLSAQGREAKQRRRTGEAPVKPDAPKQPLSPLLRGLTPETPRRCRRCGQPMVRYREQEGDEWRCMNGHVDYGGGFVPLDLEPGGRRREPSHGGRSL